MESRTKLDRIAMLTVLLWFLIVVSWAYLYGRSGLAAAMQAPEEDSNRTWMFWLFAFGIFRLPLLVLGLGATLLAEFKLLKDENGAAPSTRG